MRYLYIDMNIIKLTESQLSNIIKTVINETSLFGSNDVVSIEDVTLNGFFKKVKSQTAGKKIDQRSIDVKLGDNGKSKITFKISDNASPVILLIPFSEEFDNGKCPSCESVKRKNPTAKLVKAGKFGKNRIYHVYAIPYRNVKNPATTYSSNVLKYLADERTEGFRSQVYDDKCPNEPTGKYCGGNLTIGYGTLVRNHPELKAYKKGSKYHLSKSKALSYVKSHLDKNVLKYIKDKIKIPLHQREFDALCILSYNIGPIKDDMVNAINNFNESKIKKSWIRHSFFDGKYLAGLANRRLKEWNYFLTGIYK